MDPARPRSRRSPITAADPIVAASATELSEFAPAKINLTLRVGRKRPDGYHDLESLVVFADIGDTLRLAPCPALGLDVDGPMASHAGPPDSNLVLKAARALTAEVAGLQAGHFHLTKIVPVAAASDGPDVSTNRRCGSRCAS